MNKGFLLLLVIVATSLLTACEPKIGSDDWCKAMEKKKEGDWTINEGKAYFKHCVMKIKEEK